MRLLKRNDFTGADAKKRRFVEVACPWDSSVGIRLRSLTAKEHADFEAHALSKKGGIVQDRLVQMKRRLLALTLVNEAGDPELSEDDVRAMQDTDGGLINWAYGEACKHCRITEDEVEDLAKNSGAIGSDSSASDSPKSSAFATQT